MISVDTMIIVVLIATVLFGFLVFSESEDEEEQQKLWDESVPEEDVIYRNKNRVLTYQMLEEGKGKIDFESIGIEGATEVSQHFYLKGLEAIKNGAKAKAQDLLQQAHQISPKWPAPLFQLAEIYLEKGELDFAFEAYEDVDILFPEGYKDTKVALYYLNLEKKGELPKKTYQKYKDFLNLEKHKRHDHLRILLDESPNYAPFFLQISRIVANPDEKIRWIEQGLSKVSDMETRQSLQIDHALLSAKEGNEYESIQVLGEIILAKKTTISTRNYAKRVLSELMEYEDGSRIF